MQRATGLDVSLGRRRRGASADPRDGRGPRLPRRLVRRRPTAGSTRRGTCAPTRSRCSEPASSCASGWRSPGPAHPRRTRRSPRRHRRRDDRGHDLDRPRAPHRRPRAAGGREGRRRPRLGGLRAPPGRRDRAERGPAPRHDRDGVRHREGHLLAARGGRLPVGHVEPRRGTRPRPLDRLDRTCGRWNAACTASCPRRAGSASRRRGPRRSSTRPTTCRSPGRSCCATATEVEGASIASACGHGMMWGPAVSRIAADLLLEGRTDVVEHADRLPHGPLRRARDARRSSTRWRCRSRSRSTSDRLLLQGSSGSSATSTRISSDGAEATISIMGSSVTCAASPVSMRSPFTATSPSIT